MVFQGNYKVRMSLQSSDRLLLEIILLIMKLPDNQIQILDGSGFDFC